MSASKKQKMNDSVEKASLMERLLTQVTSVSTKDTDFVLLDSKIEENTICNLMFRPLMKETHCPISYGGN